MNTFSFYKRKPVLKENNSFGKAFLSKKRFVLAELSDKYHREGWKYWEEDLEFILAKTKIVDLTKKIAINAGETKKEMRRSHPNFGLADAIIYETAKTKTQNFEGEVFFIPFLFYFFFDYEITQI